MNIAEVVKLSEIVFSKPTMEKIEVENAMNNVDSNNTWEEQNKAARLFLDNKILFSDEEIISISKDFVDRTGFKPKKY